MTTRHDKRTSSHTTSSLISNLDDAATEKTLLQVKKAIESININVGDITLGDVSVASNDTTTHAKLDTLTSAVVNKHLNEGLDSVNLGSITSDVVMTTNVNNFPTSFEVSNLPSNQQVYGTVSVDNLEGYATAQGVSDVLSAVNDVNTSLVNKHLNVSTDSVDISGQSINIGACYATVSVSGTVEISNQISGYATSSAQTTGNNLLTDIKNKHLDKLVDSVDVSGQTINVGNLPSVQEVYVNNFGPQEVYGAVSITNYPSTQAVSGTVNIGNHSDYSTNTLQLTSNNLLTDIKNKHLDKALDSVDISGQSVHIDNSSLTVAGSVSVSNQISGYATSSAQTTSNGLLTDIKNKTLNSNTDSVMVWAGNDDFKIRNLSATVDNVDVGLSSYSYQNREPPFPASRDVLSTQLVGVNNLAGDSLINLVSNSDGHLMVEVDNFPTSFEISNLPSTQAVSGVFWQETQPVSGSMSISNFPTSFEVSNFPTSTEVSNFPTSFEISNLPATQAVSGSVSVNTISGFALESGGNLASIKTNTDKLKSDGVHTDAIQVEVKNDNITSKSHTQGYDANLDGYYDITNTSIGLHVSALDVAVKNSVEVSNSFTLDTTTQSTNTKLDTIHTDLDGLTFDSSSNLKVNINNIGLANGTVPIALNDGASNAITSTASGIHNSIDCNIVGTVPVSGTFYQATQPVSGTFWQATQPVSGTISSNTKSGTGADITATETGGKRGLDVNLINSSIPVTGSFYQSIQTVDGTVNSKVQSSSGASIGATSASLHTYDYNVNLAFDTVGEVIKTLGVAKNGSSYVPLSCDSSGALNTTILNDTTTNSYSQVGLNMYQILPRMKSFAMSGANNYAVVDAILAGQGSTLTVNSYAWGKANANKSYWLYTPTGANVRSISYNYINSSGNEATGTATGIVNSYVALQSNIVCLNNFTVTGNVQSVASDALYITLTNANITTTSVASLVGVRLNCNNAIFTVPNNAIAFITNVDSILGTANDIYYMNVWDADGNRSIPWVGNMFYNTLGNYRIGAGEYGCIGRILTAGETVAFTTISTASTNKNIYANIKVIYY